MLTPLNLTGGYPMDNKALYILAGYDDETGRRLQAIQDRLYEEGFTGTQTKNIPMHTTMGSFPTDMEEELKAKMNECLRAARQGAVLVSPAISKGEKTIMRAAFDEGLPLIYLQENGFTDLAKPGGLRMDACAKGQLLILAPWEHHNEKLTIKRGQCLELNEMARMICE